MTYITDIGGFLESLGFTPVYYFYPDQIAPNCYTIAQYGGTEKTPATGERTTQPDIQIMIRNSDLNIAYTKATEIYELLRTVYNSRIGNTRFMEISPKAPPGYVGTENNLHHFSINFKVKF
jgi:hypothetical protein